MAIVIHFKCEHLFIFFRKAFLSLFSRSIHFFSHTNFLLFFSCLLSCVLWRSGNQNALKSTINAKFSVRNSYLVVDIRNQLRVTEASCVISSHLISCDLSFLSCWPAVICRLFFFLFLL